VISSSTRPSRPPLLKSTSEPCAPLALFRDHQQVRAGQQTKKSRQSTHTASPPQKKNLSTPPLPKNLLFWGGITPTQLMFLFLTLSLSPLVLVVSA
jgi:hypothetical protein